MRIANELSTCLYSGLMEDRSLKWNLFGGHARLIVEVRRSLSEFDVTVKFDLKVIVRNSEFPSGDDEGPMIVPSSKLHSMTG